jgi:hypothetical protein
MSQQNRQAVPCHCGWLPWTACLDQVAGASS